MYFSVFITIFVTILINIKVITLKIKEIEEIIEYCAEHMSKKNIYCNGVNRVSGGDDYYDGCFEKHLCKLAILFIVDDVGEWEPKISVYVGAKRFRPDLVNPRIAVYIYYSFDLRVNATLSCQSLHGVNSARSSFNGTPLVKTTRNEHFAPRSGLIHCAFEIPYNYKGHIPFHGLLLFSVEFKSITCDEECASTPVAGILPVVFTQFLRSRLFRKSVCNVKSNDAYCLCLRKDASTTTMDSEGCSAFVSLVVHKSMPRLYIHGYFNEAYGSSNMYVSVMISSTSKMNLNLVFDCYSNQSLGAKMSVNRDSINYGVVDFEVRNILRHSHYGTFLNSFECQFGIPNTLVSQTFANGFIFKPKESHYYLIVAKGRSKESGGKETHWMRAWHRDKFNFYLLPNRQEPLVARSTTKDNELNPQSIPPSALLLALIVFVTVGGVIVIVLTIWIFARIFGEDSDYNSGDEH